MIPKVTSAKYVENYTLWLEFSDGRTGLIDLSAELWGPVFEPLKDPATFRQVTINPDLETISWPNGADFAPEFLYEHLAAGQSVGEGATHP